MLLRLKTILCTMLVYITVLKVPAKRDVDTTEFKATKSVLLARLFTAGIERKNSLKTKFPSYSPKLPHICVQVGQSDRYKHRIAGLPSWRASCCRSPIIILIITILTGTHVVPIVPQGH